MFIIFYYFEIIFIFLIFISTFIILYNFINKNLPSLKKIPVLITRVIRLDELAYWPNVIKGRFSKDQAKKIFFDIFNAKPQKINEDWVKKLLNKN